MLTKNTLKKIQKSFGRYLSLLFIVLLGVAFFTGIRESVPNIKNVQSDYYNDTNLMDLKVISTLGINEEDIKESKQIGGVKEAIGTYSKSVLVNDNVIVLYSINEQINKSYIIDGRMPKDSNEFLADNRVYKLGDTIKINNEYTENLNNIEYKVVGTIYSPLYTTIDYGSTLTISSGAKLT